MPSIRDLSESLREAESARLTEEFLADSIEEMETIFDSHNLFVEASTLEEYISEAQKLLESDQLSEEERKRLEELIGGLIQGIGRGLAAGARATGKALAWGAKRVGQGAQLAGRAAVGTVGGVAKAAGAVHGAVQGAKQLVTGAYQAGQTGAQQAVAGKYAAPTGSASVASQPNHAAGTGQPGATVGAPAPRPQTGRGQHITPTRRTGRNPQRNNRPAVQQPAAQRPAYQSQAPATGESISATLTQVRDSLAERKDFWIKDAIKKKGALHKQLGVPQDEKIPAKSLKVASEKSGKLGRRAKLAMTLKKMHKK